MAHFFAAYFDYKPFEKFIPPEIREYLPTLNCKTRPATIEAVGNFLKMAANCHAKKEFPKMSEEEYRAKFKFFQKYQNAFTGSVKSRKKNNK